MSVIIRLQNLPWSANALNIRQFFKGLSIPEGGVHIVGGEMGDAFIAFSTDEDARQAMMRDREKLIDTPIRLLLSSRNEMQKVIETARQQSLLALQNKMNAQLPTAASVAATPVVPSIAATPIATNVPPPVVNPLMATANALPRAAISGVFPNALGAAPSFLAYQQQAGIALYDKKSKDEANSSALRNNIDMLKREDTQSNSRDRRRSRTPDRDSRRRRSSRSRSRSRERERDWKDRRTNKRSRSRERSSERSYGRDNSPNRNRNRNLGKDTDVQRNIGAAKGNSAAAGISPWSINPINNYQNNYSLTAGIAGNAVNQNNNPFTTTTNDNISRMAAINKLQPITVAPPIIPSFQSYASSATTTVANTLNTKLFGTTTTNSNDASKQPFATQNPYISAIAAQGVKSSPKDVTNSPNINVAAAPTVTPMFPGLYLESKSDVAKPLTITPTATNSTLPQEPIAFANVNPYAQMFPSLFEQAKNLGTTPKINAKPTTVATTTTTTITATNQNSSMSPRYNDSNYSNESCSIKVSNMCGSTTYSDLRKFFAGLFIPHNGIKLINDKHGQRIGTAFIQFSRSSSVQKAITRNNTYLKNKQIKVEMVSDEEFEKTEDSFRPMNRFDRNERSSNKSNWDMDDNSNSSLSNRYDDDHSSVSSFIVLFLEDVPGNTTEQDIMKIFSSYTIVDILLMPSPENRRECVAYVKFSRDIEAKSALEDKSKHAIGHRKIRMRPVYHQEMEKAKEKLRLANEQLIKEEQELAEQEFKNAAKNKSQDHTTVIDDDDDNDDTEMVDLANDDSNDHESYNSDRGANNELKKQNAISNKDPRTANIPSLFELPSQKPPDSFKDAADDAPTDPRLRRKRPSRFDSGPSNTNQNSNVMNTNINAMNLNPNINANLNEVTQIVQSLSANLNNLNSINALNLMNMNNMNMNNMNNLNGLNMNAFNLNNINMNSMENNFIIMKNCDYNTRIGDIGELFMSNNLRLKHVEPLRSDRNMPTGEFIVEFVDARDAERAQSEFNNKIFRSRNLRIRKITPQEIADRLNKPFMNYMPGGNGARNSGGGNNMNMHNDYDNSNNRNPRNYMSMRGRGNNNMNNSNNRNRRNDNNDSSRRGRGGYNDRDDDDDFRNGTDDGNSSRDSDDFRRNSRDRERDRDRDRERDRSDRNERERNERSRDRNERERNDRNRERNDRDRDRERERGERTRERNRDNSNSNSNQNSDDNTNGGNNSTNASTANTNSAAAATAATGASSVEGIPEKFTKPGCVLAMENVPYKAELKDIMDFFTDFDLSPDDIIRRFNDDGSATGDARVAFKTAAIARAAFEAKKRKHIFNRSIYLNII